MFEWLTGKRKPDEVVLKPDYAKIQELCLDDPRVERDRVAREEARERKQDLVNRQAAAREELEIDATQEPGKLASMIAKRGGRQGVTDEHVELEDTVSGLLSPVEPEPEETLGEYTERREGAASSVSGSPSIWRWKLGGLILRLYSWVTGATVVTWVETSERKKTHVDEPKSGLQLSTGKELARQELDNEPIRKQLSVRQEEEDAEAYVKTAGKLPEGTIQTQGLLGYPAMDEEVASGVGPFLEGAEEDLLKFRAQGENKRTPGAQTSQEV